MILAIWESSEIMQPSFISVNFSLSLTLFRRFDCFPKKISEINCVEISNQEVLLDILLKHQEDL